MSEKGDGTDLSTFKVSPSYGVNFRRKIYILTFLFFFHQQRFGEYLSAAPYGYSQSKFAGYGDIVDSPNPGLHIEGLGPIGLPISEYDAGRLVSISRRAPYGKGEKAVLALSVRKNWRIDASQVEFRNPAWTVYIHKNLLPRISDAFDLGVDQLDAEFSCMSIFAVGDYVKAYQ